MAPVIPAFLAVDLEPDERDPIGTTGAWSGVDAVFDVIRGFKASLARRSGRVPHVTWYLRMDPQIETLEGRSDHIVRRWGTELARVEREGDSFGIHPHPLRWNASRGGWVTDLEDERFHVECLDLAAATFGEAFGTPPKRHRYGDGFLSQPIVDRLGALGVSVDLTLEPGLPKYASRADDSTIGCFPSTRTIPTVPFYPHPRRYGRPSTSRSAPLMIPLSATTRLRDGRPWWWRAGRTIRHGFATPRQALYPWLPCADAALYWDTVATHLAGMEVPYLAIAIRTDAVDASSSMNVRRVLAGLADHPLANTLQFDDPCEWGPLLATPSGNP